MRKRSRFLLAVGFVAAFIVGYFLKGGQVPPALAAQCCDECNDWSNYCQNPAPQLEDFCQNEVPGLREQCQHYCYNCGLSECEWHCDTSGSCWCVR